MEYIDDQYPNCRHHWKLRKNDLMFQCGEKRKSLATCNECRTCPNCNGRLGLYRRHVSFVRTGAHISEEYTCLNCGAYYVRTFFLTGQQVRQGKEAGLCQVEGCTGRTYEGHQHQDGGKTYLICESHHRRIKTWRYGEKGDEQKPILCQDGGLVDNPNYRKKQGKRSK